jgi:hypothetical protein
MYYGNNSLWGILVLVADIWAIVNQGVAMAIARAAPPGFRGLQFLSGPFNTAPPVTTSQVGQRAGAKRQLRALRIFPKPT